MENFYPKRVFVYLFLLSLIGSINTALAQASPTSEPLVQLSDLHYAGAFRLPADAGSSSDFQYGAGNMVYNPTNNSLFLEGKNGFVSEIGIPALVNSADFSKLNIGSVLQPFAQADDQNLKSVNNPADMSLRGLYIDANRLVYGFTSYYDAAYGQTTSFAYRPLNLSRIGQGHGPYRVGTVYPGHIGRITGIPPEWQQLLGGSALTGNFGLPIITRESFGPAAFVFDPSQLGVTNPVAAQVALDYPDNAHPLGPWDGTSNVWNTTSSLAGMAFISGTRSLLYAGIHGLGTFCYGTGGPLGECLDLENGYKGPHAYPYVYRIWAYDANDLLAVRQGTKQSWEPRPYGVWNLNIPMASGNHTLPSIAYDPAAQRLFVAQGMGPDDASNGLPVIHVYNVTSGGQASNPLPTQVYQEGMLISDHGTIYVLENGLKRPFVSMNVFTGLGYSLRNVVSADTSGIVAGAGIFTANQKHPSGTLVANNGTVYFLGEEFRTGFPSAEVFLSWGNNFKDIVKANNYDLALPQGPIITQKP